MYCQLYDLPAERGQQKRAARTTLNYFTGGREVRQPPAACCCSKIPGFPQEHRIENSPEMIYSSPTATHRGPRQIVSKTCALPAPGSAQAATSDVLPFLLEYSRPQVSVGLPSYGSRNRDRSLSAGASLPSPTTPYFRIRVHAHKIGLVSGLVRPEEQPFCLQKNHGAR